MWALYRQYNTKLTSKRFFCQCGSKLFPASDCHSYLNNQLIVTGTQIGYLRGKYSVISTKYEIHVWSLSKIKLNRLTHWSKKVCAICLWQKKRKCAPFACSKKKKKKKILLQKPQHFLLFGPCTKMFLITIKGEHESVFLSVSVSQFRLQHVSVCSSRLCYACQIPDAFRIKSIGGLVYTWLCIRKIASFKVWHMKGHGPSLYDCFSPL